MWERKLTNRFCRDQRSLWWCCRGQDSDRWSFLSWYQVNRLFHGKFNPLSPSSFSLQADFIPFCAPEQPSNPPRWNCLNSQFMESKQKESKKDPFLPCDIVFVSQLFTKNRKVPSIEQSIRFANDFEQVIIFSVLSHIFLHLLFCFVHLGLCQFFLYFLRVCTKKFLQNSFPSVVIII